MKNSTNYLGDLYTVDEFYELARIGVVGPYDGSGDWCRFSPAGEMEISAEPTNVFGPKPEWATHVMWYNK